MKQLIFLLLSLAFLASACNPLSLEPQLFTDVDGPIIIDKDGGTFNIQVKANCAWKATVHLETGVEFFSLTPDSGQADGTIQINSWKNVMNYKKIGVIEIEYGSGEEPQKHCISIAQEPREPFAVFFFKKTETVPYYGGSVLATITFNTLDYMVAVSPSDQSESVQIKVQEVPSEDEVHVGTVAAVIPSNTSSEARTFTLQLTDRQRTTVFDTFVIHQAGRQK